MSKTSLNYKAGYDDKGAFVRRDSAFRRWVTADGSSEFPAEAGRYHLYVSLACPWAHRTVIMRRLKGLDDVVSLSVVDPIRDARGWAFRDVPGAQLDPINGFNFLSQAYAATEAGYDGNVTVPVLWDTATGQIVNNESSEVIRMLNSAFNAYTPVTDDYYPVDLREEIDQVNARVYPTVNNGVYRCGFARSQGAYDRAFDELFDSLDWLEERLATRRYLCGDRVTEADWRLFTTLLRFDAVYVGHFKTNRNRIVDMPNLWGYARELYQWPGVAETVNWDHIKRHYYVTHTSINPSGIVPLGPRTDWTVPHGRS
jgi:putative glutathione S-transferase